MKQMTYYILLKGESKEFVESLTINGRNVTVRATKPTVRKRLSIVSGVPVWKVDISARLGIINNEQKELSLENMDEIKEAFNRQVQKKTTEFFRKSISKQWDLFGMEEDQVQTRQRVAGYKKEEKCLESNRAQAVRKKQNNRYWRDHQSL